MAHHDGMGPEVSAFVADRPLPDEESRGEAEIGRRARQPEAVPSPLSLAEAEALAGCFGPDDCYGLAWTTTHLIETAPGPVPTPAPVPGGGAHARIHGWAVAAGPVTEGLGPLLAGAGTAGRFRRNRLPAMLDVLTVVTAVAALLLAAWCGWAAYRDQPTKDWHFIGMAVVTLLALVQLVVGIVQLARGEKPEQGTTIFVAYLLGSFACVPAAGFLSLGERSRWGSVTVAASGVVLAVLEVRLFDIWGG